VIRPMAAPVLGGLLIADEVIDVFLPVLYFAVQKRVWAKIHGISFWDRISPADRLPQI
jgi:copper/silver efflux system protein